MRLLLVSNKFAPDYGGIETVSLALAEGLRNKDLVLEVLTHSRQMSDVDERFRVIRNPGPLQVFGAYLRADVVLHNNICLRFLWPLLILWRTPVVYAVHNWLRAENGRVGFRELIKRKVIAMGRSISVSRAVQSSLPFNSTLVYNSYDSSSFYCSGYEERTQNSVAFVGRLVQGKGCLVLVKALAILMDRGFQFKCVIVGDGVERDRIEERVDALGLTNVEFLGPLGASAIGDVLRKTEVLAVPSHYGEAFGIVALEGVASGCYVITSDDGGLPEAVGACGESVPQHDAEELAKAIGNAWALKPWSSDTFSEARAAHLRRFSQETMLNGYRRVIENARKRQE